MPLEDEFEKTMDGELEEPTEEETASEEEEGEDKSAATGESGEEETSEEEETQVSPEERIATLENESKGRLRELKSERTKRQALESDVAELKGRLTQVSEFITAAKEKKAEAGKKEEGIDEDKIPISFDDEGNPYIDKKILKGMSKADIKNVQDQVEEIRTQQGNQATHLQTNKQIGSILSSDEAYPAAFNKAQAAFKFLDKALETIIAEEYLEKPTSLSAALDIIEGSKGTMREFNKLFPGADMDSLIESIAMLNRGVVDSRKLIKTLNSLKSSNGDGDANKKGKAGEGKTLKILAKKASNLGGLANQKGKGGRDLDAYADMSIDDFLGMSDKDVAALEKAMADEEIEV